jgi:hypothetical protein
MEDVFEAKSTSMGMQFARTNMSYLHTYPIGRVHLLVTTILVMNGKLFKLPSHMISGFEVHVTVCVDVVGGSCP